MAIIQNRNGPVDGVEGVPSNVSDESYFMLIGALSIAYEQAMKGLGFKSREDQRDYNHSIDLNILKLEVECHNPKLIFGQPDTTDFVRRVGFWEATIIKSSKSHFAGAWVKRNERLYRTCVMNVTGDLDQFERDVVVMKLSGLFECP